jgi:ferredoxin
MRAQVDSDRCKGHGMCCTSCPEVFELTNHGYAVVIGSEVVPVDHEDAVRTAVEQCPEGAISITE